MTSIKSEELSGYVGSSIEQTISGLVPGVRIQTSDATPGGDINVEVRGIGTVTAGSEPLYIVDGIRWKAACQQSILMMYPTFRF